MARYILSITGFPYWMWKFQYGNPGLEKFEFQAGRFAHQIRRRFIPLPHGEVFEVEGGGTRCQEL